MHLVGRYNYIYVYLWTATTNGGGESTPPIFQFSSMEGGG